MISTHNTPNDYTFAIETKHIEFFLTLYKIVYGETLKNEFNSSICNHWRIIESIDIKEYNKLDIIREYLRKTKLKVN